jgi:hypothetical protein
VEPRKEVKQEPKTPEVRREEPKPKLQIVKLEERIAPKITTNHNETLVRDPETAKPKAPEVRREEPKPKLQIVKLEERIAPSGTGTGPLDHPEPVLMRMLAGSQLQHNETLVRDRR